MITEKDPYEFDSLPKSPSSSPLTTADLAKIDNGAASAAVAVKASSGPAATKCIRIKSGPNSSSKRRKIRAESSSNMENQSTLVSKTTNTTTTTTTATATFTSSDAAAATTTISATVRSRKRARSPNSRKKPRPRSKPELQAAISGTALITASRADQCCEKMEFLKTASGCSSSPCVVVSNGIEMKGVVIIKLSEPSSPIRSDGARLCSSGAGGSVRSPKKLWASSPSGRISSQTTTSFVDLIAHESLLPPIEPIVEITIPSPRDASSALMAAAASQAPLPQPVVVEPPDFEDIITSKAVPHQQLDSHFENQMSAAVVVPQSSEFSTPEPTVPTPPVSHSPLSPPAPPQTPQNREESVLFAHQTQLLLHAQTGASEELDGMQWEEFPGFDDESTSSREQLPAKRTLLSCTAANFGEASDDSDDGTAPGISFAFDDFFSVYCNL